MTQETAWDAELLQSISNLVCVLDRGAIRFINPAGAAMLRADSVDDLIGVKLATFMHTDYADFFEDAIAAFAEEEAGVPMKIKTLNGALIDIQMRVKALANGTPDVYLVECQDITNYIRASEEARSREKRLANVLGAVADAIITINEKGTIDTLNPATEQLFGYTKREMIGQNVKMLMPSQYADHHDGYLRHYVQTGESSVIGSPREMEGRRKDGSFFSLELMVTELRDGPHRLFTGVVRDITERKKAQQRIEHLAHHDPLTGLPNRTLYNDRLSHALYRAKRSGSPLALMFIDLDKFKPVNDQLGHEAGDTVLQVVAERLTTCVRTSDTVARVGGDEFVAVLENLDHWENAAIVAKKIIQSLREPIPVPGNKIAQIGASIGISLFPGDGTDQDTLTRAADVAMYAVKEAGRNDFRFFKQTQTAAE